MPPMGPKIYNRADPRKVETAVARRNYVLGRMRDLGLIGDDEAEAARAAALIVVEQTPHAGPR
jgi:membrane peptidoglycan carboxypeptidase